MIWLNYFIREGGKEEEVEEEERREEEEGKRRGRGKRRIYFCSVKRNLSRWAEIDFISNEYFIRALGIAHSFLKVFFNFLKRSLTSDIKNQNHRVRITIKARSERAKPLLPRRVRLLGCFFVILFVYFFLFF